MVGLPPADRLPPRDLVCAGVRALVIVSGGGEATASGQEEREGGNEERCGGGKGPRRKEQTGRKRTKDEE